MRVPKYKPCYFKNHVVRKPCKRRTACVGRRQQFLYSRQISNLTTLKKMSFLAITKSCKWTWKWWHEMPFCYCKSIILACFRFLIKKRTTKSRVIYKSKLLSVEKNAHPLRWQRVMRLHADGFFKILEIILQQWTPFTFSNLWGSQFVWQVCKDLQKQIYGQLKSWPIWHCPIKKCVAEVCF